MTIKKEKAPKESCEEIHHHIKYLNLPSERVCPDCEGWGRFRYTDGEDTCSRCEGEGVIYE